LTGVSSEESSDEEELFHCEHCEYITKTRRGLNVHIGKKQHMNCKHCKEVFDNVESFK
jgi:uncharacterized C2H2 Zn-finger protein